MYVCSCVGPFIVLSGPLLYLVFLVYILLVGSLEVASQVWFFPWPPVWWCLFAVGPFAFSYIVCGLICWYVLLLDGVLGIFSNIFFFGADADWLYYLLALLTGVC